MPCDESHMTARKGAGATREALSHVIHLERQIGWKCLLASSVVHREFARSIPGGRVRIVAISGARYAELTVDVGAT